VFWSGISLDEDTQYGECIFHVGVWRYIWWWIQDTFNYLVGLLKEQLSG
jgi:hypothetical protein